MNAINYKIISSSNPEDTNVKDYFVMPYYDPSLVVYINMSKDSITWFNSKLKKITGYKKIESSIKKLYANSKFNGYNITIIGFLSKNKNTKTLMIFDLLLKDEIDGKIQSKKYSIRVDNIRNRFFQPNVKNILPVFCKKNDTDKIDDISMQMIESDAWDGFILYLDKPYNYEDNNMLFCKLWELKTAIISGYDVCNNPQTNEPMISNIYVIDTNNISYKICGGLAELQKIPIVECEKILNKEILFKFCIIKTTEETIMRTKLIKF